MSNSVLKVTFGFSLIIAAIAIFLFYITLPAEPTFIPIVISLGCALIVSALSIIFYQRNAKKDGDTVNTLPVIIIYFSIVTIAVLIRIIILLGAK